MSGKTITHSVLLVPACPPAPSAIGITEKKTSFCSVDNVIGTVPFYPLCHFLSLCLKELKGT